MLTSGKGLISDEVAAGYLRNSRMLELSHELFYDRVIIFKDLKSDYVLIKSHDSTHSIKIGIKEFPYLGIWSASAENANFVCIEPWYGISDSANTNGNFKDKNGIIKLPVGDVFTTQYFIEIY